MALKSIRVELADTETDVVMCPATTEGIARLFVGNRSVAPKTVDLLIYRQADGLTESIVEGLAVAAASVAEVPPVTLEAGDKVVMAASVAGDLVASGSFSYSSATPLVVGITPAGEYSAGATYGLNEAVSLNGSSYLSRQAGNFNNDPETETAWWMLLAAKGPPGGAPDDAEYLVRVSAAGLSAARAVVNTASVWWEWATGGEARAHVDPWATKAITEHVAIDPSKFDTPADAFPPTDKPYRYILLTAGEAGTGEYNEGVLTNESVSGSAPLVVATAEINFPASPLHGKTINLINTERRVLRAGSAGTTEADALQNITGGFALFPNSTVGSPSGAFGTTTPNSTTGSVAGSNNGPRGVDFDASRVARTATETRAKNIGVTVLMRIA